MRVLFLTLCVVCGVASWAKAGEPMRFVDTDAAKAFEQKRYPKAEKEFLRLLETNPDNLLVLRYLAMTYDRQGRYTEALRFYVRALKLSPHNVALLYHSGETLFHAHYGDDARRHFQLVMQYAPDTEYATLARQHLDALSQQRVARQSPGAPRAFGVYAELGLQRDEVDYANADGTSREVSKSTRMTEYVSLEAYLLRRSDWVINLEASGYGAQYVEDEDDRKDIWQYSAGGLIQRSGRIGAVPVVGTLRGSEQWVQFDGGPDYSESSSGTAGLQAGLTRQTTTKVYYRFTDDRFEEKGFDPELSSRDAENHVGGIQHTFHFLKRQGRFTLGAEYQENQAEGLNFIYEGPQYSASLSLPLVWGVRLDASYQYTEEDYTDFVGPVARETERREWSGALSRWFGRRVLARLSYAEADEDSSLDVLAYTRRGYGVSVAYVY